MSHQSITESVQIAEHMDRIVSVTDRSAYAQRRNSAPADGCLPTMRGPASTTVEGERGENIALKSAEIGRPRYNHNVAGDCRRNPSSAKRRLFKRRVADHQRQSAAEVSAAFHGLSCSSPPTWVLGARYPFDSSVCAPDMSLQQTLPNRSAPSPSAPQSSPTSPRAKDSPLRAALKACIPLTARDRIRAKQRDMRRSLVRALITVARWVDLNVAQASDVYSPLPVLADLERNRARWNRPSSLAGVRIDTTGMRHRFERLHALYAAEFDALPPYSELAARGLGPGFTEVDARTLYYMLRDLKPNRYLEVGSGLSTYYCSLAAERNLAEGAPLEIICIEPYPYPKLREIPGLTTLIEREVQDVDLTVFQTLTENDVLFIDSSHVVRLDGDVPYLFLEVLPQLNAGVVVQIHDVPFPYNSPYPADHWVFGAVWPRFWTEAMLTQAFLAFNQAFQVQLSLPYWRDFDEAGLHKLLGNIPPIEQDSNPFSSLWVKKIA
jgi:hypothetical protein